MSDPYCLAMVLCDQIYRDGVTGKPTLLGLFSAFHPRKLPAPVEFSIYAEVTDGAGQVGFAIRICDARFGLDDGDGLFTQTVNMAPIQLDNPLKVVHLIFDMKIELPKAGHYRCELLANGNLIMARRMIVDEPQDSEA